MPMLLEDLAEETSASNRRVAERLDAEARQLDAGRPPRATVPEDVREACIAASRLATNIAVARVPQHEEFMRLAVAALRKEPFGETAEGLLHSLLTAFQTCRQLVHSARSLWAIAEQKLGITPERLD